MKRYRRPSNSFETCPVKQVDFSQQTNKTKQPKKIVTRFFRPVNSLHSQSQSQSQTIQSQQLPLENRIKFKIQKVRQMSSSPGVGDYQISAPIIKPAYETYQKDNHVILVKINHIGGTSSFRSQEDRFATNSIPISLTPGPGTYNTVRKRTQSRKYKQTYSENYDVIQELLRSNREVVEPFPNYKLQKTNKMEYQYNGIPRHLQEMYVSLSKQKQVIKPPPGLQLDRLVKLRKRAQKMSIISPTNQRTYETIQNMSTDEICEWRGKNQNKLTQTLYRLQKEKIKQQERVKKIRVILEGGGGHKRHSASTVREWKLENKKSERLKQKFNQNMINMIFEQNRVHQRQDYQKQAGE